MPQPLTVSNRLSMVAWIFLALMVLNSGRSAPSQAQDDKPPPSLAPVAAASSPSAAARTWSLRGEFRGGARRLNPNPDHDEHSAWHFLRTTRSEGPIESRQWLRDGRYRPLSEQGDRVFGLPFDGWIFQASPAESPAVAIASEDKAAGLAVQRGDVIVTPGPQHAGGDDDVAPGPQHAVVVAWESPVS
ncbi:MAG TPA: hypothetical protein PLV92_29955, partial [Pirellulaceae bacterium]|nr:hypothetical protein [Pirellulaceae bacterium]